MPESHSSTNSKGSLSVALEPSFTGFEATRKMREKLREINDRLVQTSDLFSLQPSSLQSTPMSIESSLRKNSHGFSRDVVVECQDSFKVLSRDSRNVESISAKKDSKEVTDTEAGRGRQMEESSKSSECPFVGSREEEELANFVAENLWNGSEKGAAHNGMSDANHGSLGHREAGSAKEHFHCSSHGLLTEEASGEDARNSIGSKAIENDSHSKKQSSRTLSSYYPASNALEDLVVFHKTFHNRNAATIEVLDKDPPNTNTQKVSTASSDKYKNSETQAASVTDHQSSTSSGASLSSTSSGASLSSDAYCQIGAKNQLDTTQNMDVFTGRSESEARFDAVEQVSCCTDSFFAGSALHKLASSQARDSDSTGEVTYRSFPTLEVSVSKVSTDRHVSVSVANVRESQKFSDATTNIIEHLRALLRERLPREEPANARADKSETIPTMTPGGSLLAKDSEALPIYATSKISSDEVSFYFSTTYLFLVLFETSLMPHTFIPR